MLALWGFFLLWGWLVGCFFKGIGELVRGDIESEASLRWVLKTIPTMRSSLSHSPYTATVPDE